MSMDAGAAAPCCDAPAGADAAGLLRVSTLVSVPPGDSRTMSDVFVCSVLVVSLAVVSTGERAGLGEGDAPALSDR